MSLDSISLVPRAQVLEHAKSRGLTCDQFDRGRDDGLFQRCADQYGLGQGTGSVAYYPHEILSRIDRVAELRKENRKNKYVLGHLFLDGEKLELPVLRETIDELTFGPILRRFGGNKDGFDTAHEVMEKVKLDVSRIPILKHFKKRLARSSHLPVITENVIAIGFGESIEIESAAYVRDTPDGDHLRLLLPRVFRPEMSEIPEHAKAAVNALFKTCAQDIARMSRKGMLSIKSAQRSVLSADLDDFEQARLEALLFMDYVSRFPDGLNLKRFLLNGDWKTPIFLVTALIHFRKHGLGANIDEVTLALAKVLGVNLIKCR